MKLLDINLIKIVIVLTLGDFFVVAHALPVSLSDTHWCLHSIQSMDDAIGVIIPNDSSRYTMELKRDGSVTMKLNCNNANGTWRTMPSSDGVSGQFELGSLMMTKMMCSPPSLDIKIAKDAQYIRSYLVKDGNLYLSLMADGGIYVWMPVR